MDRSHKKSEQQLEADLRELERRDQELRRAQVVLEASRDRLLELYELAPVGYLTISETGLIQEANLTAADLLGVDRRTLWGTPLSSLVAPGSLAAWKRLLSALRKSPEPRSSDLELQRNDGSTFTGHLECRRLGDGEAAPPVRIAFSDVSAHRQAVADLRLRESLLTAILDGTDDGILVVGSTGRVLRANRRFQTLWRIPDELVAAGEDRKLLAFVSGQLADPEGFSREVDRLYHSIEDCLDTVALADGRVFERFSSPFLLGGPGGRLWSFRDVTDRERSAAELTQANARFRSLAATVPGMLYEYVLRPDGSSRFLYVGPSCQEILEVEEQSLLGDSGLFWSQVHPDDAARLREEDAEANRTGRPFSSECRIVTPSGRLKWISLMSRPALAQPGQPAVWSGFVHDITERRRAEDARRRSEATYRGLFDTMMDGLVVVDMSGVIRESNQVYRQMLGYSQEELGQLTYQQLTPEAWRAEEARIVEDQILARGYSDVYEKEYRRKDGTVFPVELRAFLLREHGSPIAMWAIIRDVSERKAAAANLRSVEQQFAIASRLAAMGTLVAGMAHEINNPLSVELGNGALALEGVGKVLDQLRREAPLDRKDALQILEEVAADLEEAQRGGQRIQRIVKDLAVLGRPDAPRRRSSLPCIVEAALRWLPASVARSADVQVEQANAPDVMAAPGQIEQVVVNLVTNAAKATPAGALAPIIIRIGPGSAGMARLEVVDQGAGIDPAIQGRIFEPFFTTREVGQGIGLGLSVSYAIVMGHGGTLTVESAIGRGSTFQVELPATTEGEPA